MATRRSNGEGTVWYAKTEGRFRAQYPDANGHRRTITGTVEELLVSFIESLEGKREPKTIERYALDVNNYLVPTLGKLKLNQLTSDIIEIAYSTMKRDFVLSDNSMAHCHATLRGAIKRGIKHNLDCNWVVGAKTTSFLLTRLETQWNLEKLLRNGLSYSWRWV